MKRYFIYQEVPATVTYIREVKASSLKAALAKAAQDPRSSEWTYTGDMDLADEGRTFREAD